MKKQNEIEKVEKNTSERVHISLPSELLEKIDREMTITGDKSRSSFCRRAIIQYVQSLEAMRQMPDILKTLPDLLFTANRMADLEEKKRQKE